MRHTGMMAILTLSLAAPAVGQGIRTAQPVEVQASLEKQLVERARMGVESRITTGAPYSAEAVTESVQVLSDGNRIARKTPTRIHRDSEGRTRREQLNTSGEVQSVNITDPVSGSMYVLHPADRTAQRASVFMASATGLATAGAPGGGGGTVTVASAGVRVEPTEVSGEVARRREVEVQAASGGGGAVTFTAAAPVAVATMVYPAEGVSLPRTVAPSGFATSAGQVTKEELGTQIVEGVVATGTRTTTTIAAGSIGNEQPILVVTEQWFSPDLKVLVMTKHSDPRSGETTYRLTNIVQAEPARSLFEVPADYTIKEPVIRRQSPAQR